MSNEKEKKWCISYEGVSTAISIKICTNSFYNHHCFATHLVSGMMVFSKK